LFCFSNIFPAEDLGMNDIRTLVISSPSSEFISLLYEMVSRYKNTAEIVRVGHMKFRIVSHHTSYVKVPDDHHFNLITGTPIIVRISRESYETRGVKPRKDYPYIYWRSEYPVDLFISHIENNLRKKYCSYFGCNDDSDNKHLTRYTSELFYKLKFKKQISTRLFIAGSEQIVIGTLWEFIFEGWGNKKLIEFALDVGLGERNPLGFGFMNLITNKNIS
jgi:CRISPR-associated endoribonuclease Cas6